MGVDDLKWRDLCAETGVMLYPSEYDAGWPNTFRLAPLATLQRPWKPGDIQGRARCLALFESLVVASTVDSGLSFAKESRLIDVWDVDGTPRNILENTGTSSTHELPPKPHKLDVLVVTANSFKAWLTAHGESPSSHIQSWFDAICEDAQLLPDVMAKSPENSPSPVSTTDIANAFDGLRWKEEQWKKPLGDKPKWLASCVAIPGVRGISETKWNPVLVGAALIRVGHAKQNSIRSRFQTKPQLAKWLNAWKTYEADELSVE